MAFEGGGRSDNVGAEVPRPREKKKGTAGPAVSCAMSLSSSSAVFTRLVDRRRFVRAAPASSEGQDV